MRGLRTAVIAMATAVAAVASGLVPATPAHADVVICDQYGSTTIQGGRYIAMNNRWGASTTQCITVNDTGFRISTSNHNNATNGAPAGYPAVYWGCHYANCTPNFSPIQASSSAFGGVSTSVSMSYPDSGEWNAAYDIWFDPTARRDGQNTGLELMIWLNHRGRPQPIGSRIGSVSLAGGTWDVWFGNVGWNVVSYVRTSGTGSMSFPVNTFYTDAVNRGYAQRSWYMTSIQAGFEPWVGGAGLAVNSFSVSTGTSAPAPSPSPTTSTSPAPSPSPTATTAPPPSGSVGCSVSYRITNNWGSGWTADVTVRNSGTTSTRGWRVTAGFPSTQRITNAWNASWAQSGQTATFTNLSYNGSIPAGGTTTFGFQASGSAVTPSFSCTAS